MILVGGENLIDFVQGTDQDGKPAYLANPGGSPMNCAMALARQEVPTGYVTPVSTDALGDLIADRLAADGVNMLGGRAAEPTSLAVVSLTDGIPSYAFHREGTAERQITREALTSHLSGEVQGFHVGSLALAYGPDAEAFEAFFFDCKARGVLTSMDPNIRAMLVPDRASYMARLERMMAEVDILKLSDEDVEWMYPDGGLEELRAKSGAALTVLTRGPDGAEAWTAAGAAKVEAHPVDPLVDTVGAGDTFSGTLMAEVLRRGLTSRDGLAQIDADGIETLLSIASKAAAINCTRAGCVPPTLAELLD